jgi:DNA topoisomerase-1
MALTPATEEVAGFYAVMHKTDYMQKEQFKKNFFKDWRNVRVSCAPPA